MTTEAQLLAVYGPIVPLDKVCDVYFNVSIAEARRLAGRNELPLATFRLRDSQKAPLLVKVSDLATYIDNTHEAALAEWTKSNS